jgi:hypothetical protein
MALIDELVSSSNSTEELSNYIDNNSTEIYDFFISQSFQSISAYRDEIESFILLKYQIYSQLDFDKGKNKTFILGLLDVSERFGFHLAFQRLFDLSQINKISIGSRLKASSKFLVGIHNVSDYSDRLPEVVDLLATSYLHEEDSEEKVISTLIHYYTEVLLNFGTHNLASVVHFRLLLLEEISRDDRKYLLNPALLEILNEAITDIEAAYETIHLKLDLLLERSREFLPFEIGSHLIEIETEYVEMLDSVTSKFQEIRELCKILYSKVSSDEIFWSLQRGVKVLTDENQLLAYINSYGNMHHAKVMSALTSLPSEVFTSQLEIYDWGCGQGLATMCLLEYSQMQDNKVNIKSATLIEPSEIAIKRAALHVKKFKKDLMIITKNKDLDSIRPDDFNSSEKSVKIHLFSNILDIDLFSMSDLVLNIKNSFNTSNYFVCVSPYVTDQKTQRLNDFVENFENYEMLSEITERKGEWKGTNWSRVMRVFKAEI